MNATLDRLRSTLSQPHALIAVLVLVALIGGLLGVRTIRRWRTEVIETNMALSANAARQLAVNASAYLADLPREPDGTFAVHADTLDLQLTLLATRYFATSPGLKGGFWMIAADEFMGYSNPWSPPPAPAYGPPPRSYAIILGQIKETIATGESVVRLHEFETVSVSKPVFPLATEPVTTGDGMVGVAWARIHIERLLPAPVLGRYINVTAFVGVFAFLAVLLTTLHQRREIRSLNASLQLIERDPDHRLTGREGMFGSIRDAINAMMDTLEAGIRERRELEQQLHQQDKMAALGALLAGVAHEVKTPLAILKTRVQIWQRDLKRYAETTGQPQPLTEDSMQIVLHEIDRLSDLLRKLLYFSRPVRSDLMHALEADDLLRHTVLFIKPRLLEKRVDLDMHQQAGSAEILGEPDALHQVFLNILTNSVTMVDEGGRISVATQADEAAGQVVIDIADTGPGLAPEDRDKVFTPFFSRREGGAGLGLAIAYEIVGAHRGSVAFIDPVTGTGAHCRITLPLHRPPRNET